MTKCAGRFDSKVVRLGRYLALKKVAGMEIEYSDKFSDTLRR
jgi:hypothetical protein